MINTTNEKIHELLIQSGVPYADVVMYRDHIPKFRYHHGASGSEKLMMFSVTKVITAVCAMRLIEEGKLSLDDTVEKFIPSYRDVFLTDENGQKRKPKNPVTIRHLFTMSAGLDYRTQSDSVKRTVADSNGNASTFEVVSSFAKEPLSFEPGEKFQYSWCHDVLAAVTEICAGEKFSDYVKRIVFDPLGMNDSSFSLDTDEVPEIFVSKDQILYPTEKKNPFHITKNYESGGAGLVSTVSDYIKFADTLACGGSTENGYRLLKPETVSMMSEDLHLKDFGCAQGKDYGYGYGVRVRTKATDWGLPVGEFGWDGAAGSYVMVDPVNHISVFIGMHIFNWPEIFREKHLKITRWLYEDVIRSL